MNTKLAEAMEKAQVTPKQLAEAIGVDRSMIAYYKRGVKPSLDRALMIAKLLNVSVEDIFLPNNVE